MVSIMENDPIALSVCQNCQHPIPHKKLVFDMDKQETFRNLMLCQNLLTFFLDMPNVS